MAWGSLDSTLSVADANKGAPKTTGAIPSTGNLSPGEAVVVQADRTDAGTTTKAIIRVQETLDDSSETWSFGHGAIQFEGAQRDQIEMPPQADPKVFRIILAYKCRLYVTGDDSTDLVDISFKYRRDGVSI